MQQLSQCRTEQSSNRESHTTDICADSISNREPYMVSDRNGNANDDTDCDNLDADFNANAHSYQKTDDGSHLFQRTR